MRPHSDVACYVRLLAQEEFLTYSHYLDRFILASSLFRPRRFTLA